MLYKCKLLLPRLLHIGVRVWKGSCLFAWSRSLALCALSRWRHKMLIGMQGGFHGLNLPRDVYLTLWEPLCSIIQYIYIYIFYKDEGSLMEVWSWFNIQDDLYSFSSFPAFHLAASSGCFVFFWLFWSVACIALSSPNSPAVGRKVIFLILLIGGT